MHDMDLVIVYGVPTNMSQLYQVNLIEYILCTKVSANNIIMLVVVWKSWTRG